MPSPKAKQAKSSVAVGSHPPVAQKPKQSKKPKAPPVSPLTSLYRQTLVSDDTVLSSFRAANAHDAGNSNVLYEVEHYFDAGSGHKISSLGVSLGELPGVDVTSTVQLRHCVVEMLEPGVTVGTVATSDSYARNCMVLSGCLMTTDDADTGPTLEAASDTLLVPSNVPKWQRVFSMDYTKSQKAGRALITNNGVTEISRFSLIDPDSGLPIGTTFPKIQVRYRLKYAASVVLQTNFARVNVDVPAFNVQPVYPVGQTAPCFPKVVGLLNNV